MSPLGGDHGALLPESGGEGVALDPGAGLYDSWAGGDPAL
jgi:hypothetical protein